MADLDQPWVMPSAGQAPEGAPAPSASPNIAAQAANIPPSSPSNPPNAAPTPPPLPAPWSQVVSQPAIQKLNPDGRRAAFQKWSGLMLGAMNNNPQFTPEVRQAVVGKIQGQYQQFDDAAKPGLLSNIGNAALGAAAIPAVAGAVVGEEAQAPFTGEYPLADTAGRQAAVVAQEAKTGRVGTLLQDVGVLTGQVAPSTPTPSERQQDLDTTFNYLKQQAEAGKPITPDFVKAWGQMVHARAATANDESPSNYTGLDRDPLSPDNAALITNYAKTLDPIYLNALKERMTTPEAMLQAQEQQGGSLVGTLPRWAQQQIEGTLNPVNIAATAATLPLGGEGGEALQTARAFGTAADVAKAAGRELLAHGAQGAGIFAASNVAQTALNPNATPKDFGDAVLSGLVTGGIVGAGVHALSTKFGALSPVEQTAVLNKLSLTPAQWEKMSDNAHEETLQGAVDVAERSARAGSLAGASQENAGATTTPPPQIPPEEAAAAQQQVLARMGLAGGFGNAGEVSEVLRTSGGGGPVPLVGEPVKPPSTIEPLPIPKSQAIPQLGPDRPADVMAFKKQIRALPPQDFSLDEKAKLTDLADESLDDAKEEFLKLSQQKAQYQPRTPAQGLSGASLRGPATISDVLGKSRLSDNAASTTAPLANATLTTPKGSATPTLEAAPTPKPDKALTNNEARGENVQQSKISQPQAPTTYQGSKEALEAQQPALQAAQQQGQLPPGGQTAQTEPVNPGTIKPAKPLSQFSPLGQPVEAEKAGAPLTPVPKTTTLPANAITPQLGEVQRGTAANPLIAATSDIRTNAQAVARSNGRQVAGFADEVTALKKWADQNNLSGRITPPGKPQFIGGEHEVWGDPQTNRYFKATHEGTFGHAASGTGIATPADYLERLALQNALFGDDVRVESVNGRGEDTQIVTSQPNVVGRLAPIASIDSFMAERGLEKVKPYTYLDRQSGIVIGDAKPKNVLQDSTGKIVPIDVQIERLTPQEMQQHFPSPQPEETQNATPKIGQQESNPVELPRVPPRPNVPENGGQVREGQSLGPNGGGSPVNRPEGPPVQQGPSGVQAAPLRAESPPAKPIDVLTTINTSRSARVSVPDEASHVQLTLPSGRKKVLTADRFKKNVADGIYSGVGVKDVTPGKLVNGKFTTKGIDGDITVKPGAGGFTLNPKDAAAAVYKYIKDKTQWAAELAKRGVDLGKGALETLWNYVRGLSPRQLDIHEAQHFQDTAEGKFKERFTDSDARLRALVNAKDVDLPPALNPADARENLPGQRRYGTEYFKARINQVLKSVIQNAKDAKIPVAQYLKELNQELVATHAPERNAVHGEGAAGMTDDQAAQIKSDLKNRPYYDKLQADADSVRAVNQEALQRRLDTQLISQKTFDKLNELYPNHVPLNRILPEDAMKDVDTKLGGGPGLNVMSSGMRGAKGSDLPVQDVLGNVQANAIDAATRGSKNMADLQSVDFYRNNADKLNADGPAVKVITPKIVDKSKSGALIYAEPEHPDRTLVSRENGRPVYVEFHDKGLGQIMQGLNVAAPNGALVKAFGRIVNFMGQLQTTYSLGFKPNHFIRSAENLFFNISNETGKGTALQNIKRMVPYQMQSIRAVADWMRGADTPLARQYDQYREGGGIMGGFDSMSREEHVNSIQKRLSELQRSKLDPRNYPAAAIKVFHALDQFSDATSRFTAYRLALDAGKSRQEANAIARRVALDFDKNGTATKELNNIFKYSKIGLQSTGQLAKVLVNPKSAALAVGTIGLVVIAQNNWNDAMDPNWRKDIPQGVQDSQLPIITKPRDQDSKESPQYIPMPFAYAYTPIKVALQEAYNMATGRQTDPADAAKHVVGSAFLKELNPLGGTFDAQHPVESVVQTLTPTALRPIAEAGLNRAWTGKPIHPDYNGAAPSQVYFPGTKNTLGGRLAIGASGALAKAGLQVSPNTVGYIAGQYGAGPLSAFRYLGDTGAKVARGEPLSAQDIPGSHFVASTNPNFQRTRQDLAPEQQALQEDKTAQAVRTRQAEELYDQLKGLPDTQQSAIFQQALKSGDAPKGPDGRVEPQFLNEMNRLAKNDDLDASAKVVKQMDTEGRAEWLFKQYNALKDDSQWNAFMQRNKDAGIATPTVIKRLNELAAGAQ